MEINLNLAQTSQRIKQHTTPTVTSTGGGGVVACQTPFMYESVQAMALKAERRHVNAKQAEPELQECVLAKQVASDVSDIPTSAQGRQFAEDNSHHLRLVEPCRRSSSEK